MDKKYLSCIISGTISTILQPLDALRVIYLYSIDLKIKGDIGVKGNTGIKNVKEFISSIKGLYNGFTFNCATHILKQAASYPTQEYIKNELNKLNYLSNLYKEPLAGMLSGAALAIVSTPINVIKIPLISDPTNRVMPLITQTYKNYGLKGFFRGGVGTLIRDVVWSGIYFPAFYYINKKIDNRFASSTLSAAFALCFSYPFDGIRLYRQNNKENYNFWHGFKQSFNTSTENRNSFLLALLRVPISIACSHYVYLKCNEVLE